MILSCKNCGEEFCNHKAVTDDMIEIIRMIGDRSILYNLMEICLEQLEKIDDVEVEKK